MPGIIPAMRPTKIQNALYNLVLFLQYSFFVSIRTDKPSGVSDARKKGISVVAIGMPQGVTKIFSLCMPYDGLKKTVAKFLNAYSLIAGNDL